VVVASAIVVAASAATRAFDVTGDPAAVALMGDRFDVGVTDLDRAKS
jgi:hypothetical protein